MVKPLMLPASKDSGKQHRVSIGLINHHHHGIIGQLSARTRYCSTTLAWQRNGTYLLDCPLGSWIQAERHIRHTFNRTRDGIIVCDENGLTTYAPTGISGHYSSIGPCHHVPHSSHLIQAQYTATGVWTHQKYCLHQVSEHHPSPIIVHDTFHHTSKTIDVVSDALVHSWLCKAAIAYG